MLTWWQDPLVADGSKTAGEVIANSAYQTIAIVRAGNGYQPDLHEFQITPQGTALITVYDAIDCNLSSRRRPARRRRRGHAAAGDRFEDRPRDLRVALARPRAAGEHLRLGGADEHGRTLRLLPHQLDRRRAERRPAGLLAQHLGGVRRRSENRPAGLGAGRQALDLHARPRRGAAWQHDAIQQPDGAITFFDNGATPVVTSSRAGSNWRSTRRT